jgi:YD repeat-containing protein
LLRLRRHGSQKLAVRIDDAVRKAFADPQPRRQQPALVDHAQNPIHRRYEYDPAGELIRTLDKLLGEIKYEYEANGQLHGRDTGKLVDSEEFRYDATANRLNFNTSQFDQVKDNRIKRWRDQEYAYDAWGNLIEKRSGLSKLQTFSYDCEKPVGQS